MAVRDTSLSGMIWDGRELFVVEPTAALRQELVAPPAGADNVVFRLRDTWLEPGAASCGVGRTNQLQKGTAVYEALIDELRRTRPQQASGAMLRLQVSAIADTLMRERFASATQTRDEILIRLNNVDGIYSAQIGVEIQVPSVDIRDASLDPFTPTTEASSLLEELGHIRRSSPQLRSAGVTHLFTGRNLDGTTVGIAYLDSLCSQQFGAGLTESRDRSSFVESLIAAHEIGHNFGAYTTAKVRVPRRRGF